MNYLYILSEDDNDDVFYKQCVEKITGKSFESNPRRMRKGGGISQVRKYMKYLLNDIQYSGFVENTFFVIAMDNDRSTAHPDHQRPAGINKLPEKEQTKQCRFCEIENHAKQILGNNRLEWPIKGAIAVPVQMIESWLLLICDPQTYGNEAKLPLFAHQKGIAEQYYAPKTPPKQLKDLSSIEKDKLKVGSNSAFFKHCGDNVNSELLQEISNSFRLFKEQVDVWHNEDQEKSLLDIEDGNLKGGKNVGFNHIF